MNEANTCTKKLTREDDEIDLFELWQKLYTRKALIFNITAFFAIVSIVYALQLPKTWQAEIIFMPPQLKSVQGLNIQVLNNKESDETQYTINSVYKRFLNNFQSTNQKREYFNKNNIIKYYGIDLIENKNSQLIQIENAFKDFNASLKLNLPKRQEGMFFVTSTLVFSDQKVSADLLNQYAQMIKEKTLNNLLQEVNSQLQQKKIDIKEQISINIKIAKKTRENRIARLNEAIKIAKLLDLKNGELQLITGAGTGIINKNTPLYYQGYKSLEVEKKILEERKDDIPFILDVEKLEYQNFHINEQIKRLLNGKKKFSVVMIDQKALVPESPIKPNRKRIVIISTIIGFIFSLLIVFILNIKQKYKDEYNF